MDLVFQMFSLLSFKKAGDVVFQVLSLQILSHCCFARHCMWFFTCFLFSLSKSSRCSFPCVIITHLIRMGWISKSHHCYFGKLCMLFSALCQWISHVVNSSGYNFPCVATIHLISSGWVSIFCQCYFTKQLMWFSTFCHRCLCCHCTFHKQWLWFSTCCSCSLNSVFTFVLMHFQ